MKNGSPFGIGGLMGELDGPYIGEWMRTFAIITTDANELVAEIHDRMPLILAPADYTRWLSDEPDPGDLMRPFPAEPMRMWPISTRVNKPENDHSVGGGRHQHLRLSPAGVVYGVRASPPVSLSCCAMAGSSFGRLGRLCRLVSLEAKRTNPFAVSYLVVNHTDSSIPIK